MSNKGNLKAVMRTAISYSDLNDTVTYGLKSTDIMSLRYNNVEQKYKKIWGRPFLANFGIQLLPCSGDMT